MSAVADPPVAPPALSPAAEALYRQAASLPADDRLALADRLRDAGADVGVSGTQEEFSPVPHIPAAALRQLEAESDEAAAGRVSTSTFAEVQARARTLLAGPEDDLPPRVRAALNAGREAARRAGEESGR